MSEPNIDRTLSEGKKYHAFISYKRKPDEPIATAIHKGLHQLARPRLGLQSMNVFRDVTGLSAGPDISEAMRTKLRESEYLILLASPEAFAPRADGGESWVYKELDYFLKNCGGADRVLLVLTGGKLPWGGQPTDDETLKPALHEDFLPAFAVQPNYIDLRWARDPSNAGRLNLRDTTFAFDIAAISSPILKTTPEKLTSEDLARLRKELRDRNYSLAGLLGLFAISLSLGMYSELKRRDAVLSLQKADLNSNIALKKGELESLSRLRANREADRSNLSAETAKAQKGAADIEAKRAALAGNLALVERDEARDNATEANLNAGIARINAETARRQKDRAVNQQNAALAESLAAQSLRQFQETGATDTAVLLARQAYLFYRRSKIAQPVNVDQALRTVLAAPYLMNRLPSQDAPWSVAMSPDGHHLVVGGSNGLVELWDLRKPGVPPRILEDARERTPAGTIMALAFDRSGKRLAIARQNGTVQVWDLSQTLLSVPRLVVPLPPGGDTAERGNSSLLCVAFSPDGTRLAVGGYEGVLGLLDLREPKAKMKRLVGHLSGSGGIGNTSVDAIAFSPDGTLLATGSNDETTRLWKVADGSPTKTFKERGWVGALTFNETGDRLIASGYGGTIHIHSIEIGHKSGVPASSIPVRDIEGEGESTYAAAFIPHTNDLITGSADNRLRRWDLTQPDSPPVVIGQHENAARHMSIAASPNGKFLASVASNDSESHVLLWNLTAPPQPAQPLKLAGISSSARVTTSAGGAVKAWKEFRNGRPYIRVTAEHREGARIRWLSIPSDRSTIKWLGLSQNGNRLAASDTDGGVYTWDLRQEFPAIKALESVRNGDSAVALSADGNRLAWAGKKTLPSSPVMADPQALPQDWEAGIYIKENYVIRLRTLDNPVSSRTYILTFPGRVSSLCFTPDGQRLIIAGENGQLGVWTPGETPKIGPSTGDLIQCVTVCSAGDPYVVTGSSNGTVRVWNLRTLNVQRSFQASKEAVTAVDVSPDGKLIAAGYDCNLGFNAVPKPTRVHFWEADRGDTPIELAIPNERFTGGQGSQYKGIEWLSFSRDSSSVLSFDQEGRVRRWTVTRRLASLAAEKISRNLTTEEWSKFVGVGVPYERTRADLPPGVSYTESEIIKIAISKARGQGKPKPSVPNAPKQKPKRTSYNLPNGPKNVMRARLHPGE